MIRARILLPLALVLVLVGAAYTAPHMIGQDRLRGWIAPQLQRALRLGVAIDGDIGVSLLPWPKVVADLIRIGRDGRDIAVVPRVEVVPKILPLLMGRLQPDELRLIRPDIHLDMAPAAASPAADGTTSSIATGPIATGPIATGPIAAPVALALPEKPPAIGHVVVVEGSVTFGAVTLTPVDFDLQLDEGAAKISGHTVWRGGGVSLAASAAKSGLDATLHFDQGGELHWSGQSDALRGKLTGRIDNLARLSDRLPALPVSLSSDVQLGGGDADVKDVTLSLGDTDWQGNGRLTLGAAPRLEVALHSKMVNLDRIAMPPAKTPESAPVAAPAEPAGAVPAARPARGLTTELSLGIDQVLWRGKILQDARLNLLAGGGETTINQASVILPGNSEVALFGVVSAGPKLEGSFEGKTDDLRQLLRWGGFDPPAIPADRLHVARIAGDLKADFTEISVERVRLKFDSSQIDLSATYRPGPRPALGVSFALDQLNGDAYWPPNGKSAAAPAAAPESAVSQAETPSPPLPLDANIRGRIGRLNWRGAALQDIALDAALGEDALSVKTLTIGDVAGARVSLQGRVVDHQFDAAQAELHSKDLAKTLRSFAIELPLAVPADLTIALSGPITAPQMRISAPQLDFGKTRLESPSFSVKLEGDHVTLDHLSAGLYGGQLTGEGSLARESGQLGLHLALAQAQMRQALLEIADVGLADGVMEGEVTLSSQGHFPAELKSHLGGSAKILVKNGQIKGFDLQSADRALAAQKGVGGLLVLLQAGLTGGSTHFASLSGSAKIENGVIASNDLKLVADGGGADGAALVNLPGDNIDAHADFHFASASDAPPLVMRLTGSLQSPHRFLDVKPLQQWLADHGVKTGKPKDVLKGLLQGIVK